MKIVEYKLDVDPNGRLTTPSWLAPGNSGQFLDSDSHTLIGVIKASPRRHKVPDTVLRLTADQLKARVLNIHTRHPFKTTESVIKTDQEVIAMVDSWVEQVGAT